jgi:hypothetical protein
MISTPLISRYDGTGASAGDKWSGVARIHDGRISGSAVLLTSGLHLLTAAHVVKDLVLADSQVVFETESGLISYRIQAVTNYPEYMITSQGIWHDLALVTLEQAAPLTAARYDLYRGTDELGQTATLAGYGQAQSPTGEVLPEGGATRRAADNTIDAIGTSLALSGFRGSLADQLFYDYDDGTISHNALGNLLGGSNLGLGGNEGMITPGDSGGGLFIKQGDTQLLTGTHSFTTRLPAADIDMAANSSVGEIAGATRVSSYTQWIEDHTGQTQVPKANLTAPPTSETVARQVQEGEGVWFLVNLSGPADHVATVDFSTRDGSAAAGEDYIPTHGTLTLKENEWWAQIWVQTLADKLFEGNETFSLVLNNPQGAEFPAGQVELTAQRTIIDDITLAGVTQLTAELFG